MRPLMLDDVLPLEEYAACWCDSWTPISPPSITTAGYAWGLASRFLSRIARLCGFASRSILRVARLGEPRRVQAEPAIFTIAFCQIGINWQAALLIEVVEETRLSEELAAWQSFRGEAICLRVGTLGIPARLITCRPEDRCVGMARTG